MPREGQKSFTVPTWVWEIAEKYFTNHKEELVKRGIKSPTRLVCVWIVERSQELSCK